jgi:hypothetical protein
MSAKHAFQEYVAGLKKELPDEIQGLISMAQADLYAGPLYFNEAGEERCCFDEDAFAFEFVAAGKIINAAIEDLCQDVYIDDQDCVASVGKEPEGYEVGGDWYEPEPCYLFDGTAVRKELLGKELASTI